MVTEVYCLNIKIFTTKFGVYSGVTLLSDPFIVGMSATLTCTSDVSANQIEWLDSERRVVSRVTSMDQLDLTFNPVNDSIHDFSLHLQSHKRRGNR